MKYIVLKKQIRLKGENSYIYRINYLIYCQIREIYPSVRMKNVRYIRQLALARIDVSGQNNT